MSALDQAFIKAYAKELAPKHAAPHSPGNESARAQAVEGQKSRAPLNHLASAQIENIYADGSLYRIETSLAAEPEPVPPPHFGSRASRRLPLRYRLAQLENEEAAPAARLPQPVVPHAPPPSRKRHAQIPPPPLESSSIEIELEVPPAVETDAAAAVIASPIAASNPVFTPLASSVETREHWDELLQESVALAESAIAVWPDQEDLAAARSNSLIAIDLETMPAPSAGVTELAAAPTIQATIETGVPDAPPTRTFRLDAAHTPVPAPHQPPQPTVEELIQPAKDDPKARIAEVKLHERPLVVSEEEAAELVGVAVTPATESPSKSTTAPSPRSSISLTPAWEVDHFLWPALCQKLLSDDQSYFAQAGGKIAAAVRDGLHAIAITGSRRGEGRTTLAICIARSAAKTGLKVALVDADFSRPQLAASLGLEIAASWHDAALGKTNISEAAIKSIEDNLTVLPLDASTAAAPLSLADPRLTKMLREVASSFDLLVLDLGPTAAGDEPLFPENEAPPADAAIVVRDLRYSTPAESQAIGERLSISGIEAVGIAENFVPSEKFVA